MPPPSNFPKIIRSETSTPKAFSPPANSESERRQPSTMEPQVPLLDSLNAFAQSIMSAASLTVRRDLTKQQAVGQQKERNRQSRFKSTFLTLIEDTESRVEGTEKVFTEIEKQIDLSSQAQSNNAIALAARLLKQAEVSEAPSGAHERARLKEDIADVKVDLETTKREIGNSRDYGCFKDDIADLKADLQAARKQIDNLNREAITPDELRKKLRGLATQDELREMVTKDEVRGLVTKNELRRVATAEVRKHLSESLIPTDEKLASMTLENASLNEKMKGVEAFTRKHCETAEEKGQEQSSRLETFLTNLRMDLNRLELTIQDQTTDYASIKVDLGAQHKVLTDLSTCVWPDPSNNVSSLDKLVMRNSDQIKSLQQDCEKIKETIQQTQDLQAASKIVSPEVSTASVKADTELKEEVRLIRSGLEYCKAEQETFKQIRHDLDALKVDREQLVLIRTDLDSLINEENLKDVGVVQGFEAIEERINRQHEDLVRVQNEIRLVKQSQASHMGSNHPPTPPLVNASMSPRKSDQQKLQDVQMELKTLTKATESLRLFVSSQQQKFDGLTSVHIVQSMVHQMQQMYPQHPGNLIAWQTRVDSYLNGNLRDRLANIESQLSARVSSDSKIQDIRQYTADTRNICLASGNSIKQDIETLKDTAFYNRPQGPSDHGSRIDELLDRITTVEAKYVTAIGDLQKIQTDLVRNVTYLQNRNGIDSTGNSPRELTVISKSSKSVEPTASTAISRENTHNSGDSDSSETPLSQRADRRVQRDREVSRPPNLNGKRKAAESDDDDKDEGAEDRLVKARKVAKRRNVSGQNPFS